MLASMTVRRRVLGGAGLLALGLTALGCPDLPVLEPGTCGNRTLEEGEDCERLFEGDATTPNCLPPGANHQCRYSCAQIAPDDGPERFPCPDGWGCGDDDLCRRARGTLGRRIPTGQPVGRWFDLADMDGDGNLDIVWVSDATAAVDYLDQGVYRQSFRFPFEAEGLPNVSDADLDGRGDLLSQTERGLELLRGQPERELSRTIFTSQTIRLEQDFELVTVDLIPDAFEVAPGQYRRAPGDEVVIASDVAWGAASAGVRYGVPSGQPGVLLPISESVDDVVAAAFDETTDVHGSYAESPEQIAVPFADQVIVLRPSYILETDEEAELAYYVEAPTEAASVPSSHPLRTVVAPPSDGFRVDRMMVIQANGEAPSTPGKSRWPCGGDTARADANLDLVILQDPSMTSPGRLAIAFGLGDGTFHSDPCLLDDVEAQVEPADDTFGESGLTAECSGDDFQQSVLAYEDIDGDGMPDAIGQISIYLSGLVPEQALSTLGQCNILSELPHPENAFFRDVVTGDMDGDGVADLLASSVEPNLRFVTSQGGAQLRRSAVITGAPVDRLTTGDFDGDGLMDVAFSEASSTAAANLGLVFGARGQVAPEAVLVGTVADLDRMRAGRLLTGFEADATTDLIVATERDEADGLRFGLIEGRADRILGAPFIYAPQMADAGEQFAVIYLPRGAAIARFDGVCVEDGVSQPALFLTGEGSMGADPKEAMGAACIGDDGTFMASEAMASPLSAAAQSTAVVPIVDSHGRLVPVVAEFDFFGGQRRLELYAAQRDESTGQWTASPNALRLDNATVAGAGAPGSDAFRPTSALRRWSPFLNNVAQACDLWPDAPEGVAFLAIHDAPELCTDPEMEDVPAELKVHVASSARFTAGADMADLRELTIGQTASDEHIVGFACMNLDGDPQQELAYLVVIGDVDQCTGEVPESFDAEVRWLDIGADGQTTRVAGAVTGLLTVAGLPPATGIGAADFNRDGIEDIFLATPENGYVWLGEALR